MRNKSLRNTWLVIKREYLERVRQRSFIVLTLLLPAIMIGAFVIPAKLSRMKSSTMKRLVVVTSTQPFGEIVRQQLLASSKPDDETIAANKDKDKDDDYERQDPAATTRLTSDSNANEAEQTSLAESGERRRHRWLSSG